MFPYFRRIVPMLVLLLLPVLPASAEQGLAIDPINCLGCSR